MPNSSKMSSISNISKFSVRSQQVIAAQVVQIARMRQIMIAAGIDPDLVESSAGNRNGCEDGVGVGVYDENDTVHVQYT